MSVYRLNLDDLLMFEPVGKPWLDYHLKYIRRTEIGQYQYNNAHGDKYFFDLDGTYNNVPMFECSWVQRKGEEK